MSFFYKYIFRTRNKFYSFAIYFHEALNSYSISRKKRISIKKCIIGDTFREGKKQQCFIQNDQGKVEKEEENTGAFGKR